MFNMASQKSLQPGLSSCGLQDRLLEVAVVAGMDEETGLHIRRIHASQMNSDDVLLPLFDTHFQGHLLDILSGPQDGTGDATPWKLSLKQITTKKTPKQEPTRHLRRAVSVRQLRKKANKHEEVPVSTDFLSNMPSLCLPEDSRVYENAQKPRIHSTVLTDIDGYRHYATVLTFYRQFYAAKEEGNKWNLSVKMKTQSTNEAANGHDSDMKPCYVPCCVCFVSMKPYFTVLKDALSCLYKELVSSQTNFRKILEKYVTNLSLIACPPSLVKVKFSIGSFPIILMSPDDPVKPEQVVDIDLRLPLLIFKKEPSTLLSVLECIMHEQRIVFFSSDYSMLPLVMECFRFYIRPMEWHHQYISILGSETLGFVDCPGIFMMGCHSKHKAEIGKVENDLFLVDLDNVKISTTSHSSSKKDDDLTGQFALHIPHIAAQNLLQRIRDLELHDTISSVNEVSNVSLEEIREANLEFQNSINKTIKEIFAEFMVDIFGDTLKYLDHEHQQFQKDKFLDSIKPTDSPFYIQVFKSYMFRRFVKQRLARRTDDFSAIAQSRIQRKSNSRTTTRSRLQSMGSGSGNDWDWDFIDNTRNPSGENSDIFTDPNLHLNHFGEQDGKGRANRLSRKYTSGSFDMENHITKEVVVTIPAFPVQGTNFNSKHFFHRCVGIISNVLDVSDADTNIRSANQSSLHASLLLLRGFYKLAEDNLVGGLEDLHATAKSDARYFPDVTLKKIAGVLTESEFRSVAHLPFFKKFTPRKPAATRTYSNISVNMRSYFNDDGNASFPLEEEPFTFILEKKDVTNDQKVISILFEALCQCTTTKKVNDENNTAAKKVDNENFNAFFQTWQQLKTECSKTLKSLSSEVRLPPDVSTRRMSSYVADASDKFLSFPPDEKILKISGMVLSSKGNGRLVLTTRRLIFVAAGNEECKAVICLDEILSAKEGKMKNFLSSNAAVHIHYQNLQTSDPNTPFKIGLKFDTGIWLALINEMKTGKTITRDQRDDSITLNAAAQNVVVADAFYLAVKDENSMDIDRALEWVHKLCKFESLSQSGELKSFSRETQDKVVMRMDPSPKASKKPGIRAMSYSSGGIDETPHVWVALSSGQVRSIDTTSWKLDPKPIKDWDANPNCLCVVGGKELWMGADDTTIYILSISTMKTTRILNDHVTSVIAISNTEDESVASASITGEIIIWTLEPTAIKYKFNAFTEDINLVAFVPFKNYFCCCSSHYLVICNHGGKQLQRLELVQSSSISSNSNLSCSSWTSNESDQIWAGDSNGAIFLWDVSTLSSRRTSSLTSFSKAKDINVLKPKLSGMISEGSAITCMKNYNGKLWLGNSRGEIMIYNTEDQKQESTLKAHDGRVTSLCQLENRYMISGSDDEDGKMVVWRQ